MTPRTLFRKVWDAHVVHRFPEGPALLYVDLHLVHEVTSPQAFEGLRQAGRRVRRPELTVATVDHNVPTGDRALPIEDPVSARQLDALAANAREFGVELFDLRSPSQGIVHVIGPEQGLTQPGMIIVCGDSHTSTHGAFGALAVGIGTSEVEHVLATQCLVWSEPRTMEARLTGAAGAPRQVTWGTSPGMVTGVTGAVPDPADYPTDDERRAVSRALEYMGLEPGTPLAGLPIDRVFLGSCTNGRIEDLRAAAQVVRGRRVASGVRAMVVPGSQLVRAQAEREGLDRVFREAGFEWRNAGCSMCLGMNPDILQPGERCASTSNRNFEGRQGRGGRTHLMSPPMAAAAAVAGRLVDVREWAWEREGERERAAS